MEINEPHGDYILFSHTRPFLIAARAFGFTIGFAATLLAVYGLLLAVDWMSGYRLIPRGLGFVAFPILVGIFCSQVVVRNVVLPPYCFWIESFFRYFIDKREGRLYIAGTGMWLFCVLVYALFGGFSHSFFGVEWDAFFAWLLMPPVAGAVGVPLFVWARRPIP